MPEFYMILARKIINKIPEFHMIFVRKMPEYYLIIARKIFFPNFRGHVPPLPPYPTPMCSMNHGGSIVFSIICL